MPQFVKVTIYEIFYYDKRLDYRVMDAGQLKRFRKTKNYKQNIATVKPFKRIVLELSIQVRDFSLNTVLKVKKAARND